MKELFFTHFVQHLNFTKFTKILFSCKACCFLETQKWMFQQQQPHILVLMPIRLGRGVALPECPISLFVARWSLAKTNGNGKNHTSKYS